jgi:phage terminase large subunit GpA-like protein
MIRQGIWVAEGQYVAKGGKLKGTPRRDGTIDSFQMGSYYSLMLTGWGVFAEKWVRSCAKPRLVQNFINSWDGLPFELLAARSKPDELGERLGGTFKQGTIPADVRLVAMGIDVQEDHFKVIVLGAAPGERVFLIDYGVCDTEAELEKEFLNKQYERVGGGPPLGICITLKDSGAFTDKVYEFCRTHSRPDRLVIACKGSSSDLSGKPYVKTDLADRKKSRHRRLARAGLGQILVHVNTGYWEEVVHRCFSAAKPGDDGSLTLCAEAKTDIGLLEELLNGAPVKPENAADGAKTVWEKVDEDSPNDFRDALRYARCAIELKLRGRWDRLPAIGGSVLVQAPPARPAQSQQRQSRIRSASQACRRQLYQA